MAQSQEMAGTATADKPKKTKDYEFDALSIGGDLSGGDKIDGNDEVKFAKIENTLVVAPGEVKADVSKIEVTQDEAKSPNLESANVSTDAPAAVNLRHVEVTANSSAKAERDGLLDEIDLHFEDDEQPRRPLKVAVDLAGAALASSAPEAAPDQAEPAKSKQQEQAPEAPKAPSPADLGRFLNSREKAAPQAERQRPGRESHEPQHAKDVHEGEKQKASAVNPYSKRKRSFNTDRAMEKSPAIFKPRLDAAAKQNTAAEEAAAAVAAKPVEAQVEAPKPEKVVKPSKKVAPEAAKPADAPRQSRAEFVKQQEELWGAKDKIKPQDVPKGELTMSQFLDQRPAGEEGDTYRVVDKRGRTRTYDVVTGEQTPNAEVADSYTLAREANDYYQKVQDRIAEEKANDPEAIEKSHEAALKVDAQFEKNGADLVQAYAEGEAFIKQNPNPNVRALFKLGKEMRALYGKEESKEDLDVKKELFGIIYDKVEKAGLDQRALDHISNQFSAHVETAADGSIEVELDEKPSIEGSAYINGEKVSILDVVETADGKQKAYTIEDADGEIRAVFENEVSFKREFSAPEEAEAPKENFWMRAKREVGIMLRVGGLEYMKERYRNRSGVATHDVDPNSSPEEQHEKRSTNRRNLVLGTAITTVGLAGVALVFNQDFAQHVGESLVNGMFPGVGEAQATVAPFGDALDPTNLANPMEASGPVASPGVAAAAAAEIQSQLNETAARAAEAMNDAAFTVESGEGGYAFFEGLGLSSDVWDANAHVLADKFPNDFYRDGFDVRLAHSGALSMQAREFIQSLRNG